MGEDGEGLGQMNARFPRLTAAKAERIILARGGVRSLDALERISMPPLDTQAFAPTGPQRVDESFLHDLRAGLDAIAKAAGYPQRQEETLRTFDAKAAVFLGELELPLGEAIRSETWAWIAVHLAPHLVQWRWGKDDKPASEKRYAGILQRNALGRLWYRAYVMREEEGDPWMTLGLVNEDAHVAVLERTSIARDHRLAKSIIKHWRKLGGGEDALRQALIRVRLRLLLQDTAVLSDIQLDRVLSWAFAQAAGQPLGLGSADEGFAVT